MEDGEGVAFANNTTLSATQSSSNRANCHSEVLAWRRVQSQHPFVDVLLSDVTESGEALDLSESLRPPLQPMQWMKGNWRIRDGSHTRVLCCVAVAKMEAPFAGASNWGLL
jgi:hypothetical protein